MFVDAVRSPSLDGRPSGRPMDRVRRDQRSRLQRQRSNMTEGVRDKVVVITGASSGLGEAAARRLARDGAKLVPGARRLERLQALAQELSLGSDAAVQTDVTQHEQVRRLVDRAVQSHGRIDVMINNAGLMPLSPLERGKIEDWDRMIDVNIKGVLYGVAAALPHMKAQRSGHIINVSSVAGHKVRPGVAVYAATKHAVRALSEGLRQEVKPYNIRTGQRFGPGALEGVRGGVGGSERCALQSPLSARRLSPVAEHQKRGCPVSQDFSVAAQDPRLARDHLPPLRDDARLGANPSGVLGDRAGEVGLGLDCRVARACGQQRLSGAADGAVNERQRPSPVDPAHRIEQMRARFALERREAVADLGEPEGQRLRDRRLGQLAVDNGLKDLFPCHASDLPRSRQAVRYVVHRKISLHVVTFNVYAYTDERQTTSPQNPPRRRAPPG